MPRQHELPHTAPPAGPCDRQRDAWQDAAGAATEAAAEKKRALAALMGRMQETGVSRVSVSDPKTGKRKWLEITADPKLRSVKAETGEQEPKGTSRRGLRDAIRSELPSVPGKPSGVPSDNADADPAGTDSPDQPGAAGDLVEGDASDRDLRTPGQRRKRGAR